MLDEELWDTFNERLHATQLTSELCQDINMIRVRPTANNVDTILEGKGENYQVCSVQYCVQQLCTVQCTHI